MSGKDKERIIFMKTQLLFFLLYVPQVKDLLLVGHEKGKTNNW